jgi:hypothetical protein
MKRNGIITPVLLAAAVFLAVPGTAVAAEYFIEPTLFTSSQILNAVGLEFSPVFLRDDPKEVLPMQSFVGLSIQGAMSRKAAIELTWGRVKRAVFTPVYNPMQRLNLEIKGKAGGDNFWYLFYFDFDWGRCEIGAKETNPMGFSLGQNIGFRYRKFMAELMLGLLNYYAPDGADGDGWSDNAHIVIPLGVRFGYNVIKRGALDFEMRFPLYVGPIKDIGITVPLDMSFGYQHILGNSWLLRGSLFWACTEYNLGREEVGVMFSAKWVFF